MKILVERLRESADLDWPYALALSNIGKPKSDNNAGRSCMVKREAADKIEELERDIVELKIAFYDAFDAIDYAASEGFEWPKDPVTSEMIFVSVKYGKTYE
jgi:hypothetical protein